MQQAAEYLATHAAELALRAAEHLGLSFGALLISALIAVPLGWVASRSRVAELLAVIPAHVLRVIPSLALLALMIPLVGVGVLPAIIALIALALPPILLNTIVGFNQVPPFMIESATGMGMTKKEVFWQVQVPLALPLILAGIRLALIEIVASATLAARIGAGGLGEVIFTGLGLNRMDIVLVGGLLVAVLSLGLGALFDVIEHRLFAYRFVGEQQ